MQYLSQRLASKRSPRRGGAAEAGAVSAPQRDRILDAVERLSAEKGLTGTSIEAIVEAAGVSSVTFYEFFDGKEECFLAAFERALEAGAEELALAAEGDPAAGGLTWSEQVATGLRTLARLVAAEPERARLILVEAPNGGPELSRRFEATLDRAAAKLREGRGLATAPAELPATHEEATAGALAWLLRERIETGDAEGLERLYPELIDIALAPYLGDG
ncbi:MAG TPA: helix-turn-helix domain-containing protein [Solirubrobacterales bacterium]|jgi:AcrR family transcriptional regulator